jgi:cytochrome c556
MFRDVIDRIRPGRTCATLSGLLWALAFVALAVATAAAQTKYPIFTPTNFADAMKTVGVNFSAVNTAIASQDFATAKAQLIRSRERLALTITFWRDRKKDGEITILRDALTKMDNLDTLLSATPVDASAAEAAVKQIGANCQACHATNREQDPRTHAYRFKPGLVE